MTPNSATTPYLTAAQFLQFQDANLVGQLVRDDGTVATTAQLTAPDPNLQAALQAASGELESAALQGQRYSVADLQSANGNSQVLIQRVVAALAMMYLWDRRDGPDPPANVVRKHEAATKFLEKLASGEAILSFLETEEAGLPEDIYFTEADLLKNRLITAGSFRQMFGNRNAVKGSFGI